MTTQYKHISGYLSFCKKLNQHFLENPGSVVEVPAHLWVNWDKLDRETWKKSFLDALNARINSKGNYWDNSCKDSEHDLRRDCEVVNAWFNGKKKTQWGRNLSSRWMRDRYPNLIREMREYDKLTILSN
jgi:hypothetical protein